MVATIDLEELLKASTEQFLPPFDLPMEDTYLFLTTPFEDIRKAPSNKLARAAYNRNQGVVLTRVLSALKETKLGKYKSTQDFEGSYPLPRYVFERSTGLAIAEKIRSAQHKASEWRSLYTEIKWHSNNEYDIASIVSIELLHKPFEALQDATLSLISDLSGRTLRLR